MYEQFFGFTQKPFHIVPNPDFLYLSPKHQTALTFLEYGLVENIGFVLLTGEIGTGKTTLVKRILGQIESDMDVAVIFQTNVSSEDLIGLILREFELPAADGNKAKSLEVLNQYLIERYSKGRRVLLIIDEAQNLDAESLEELRMLSNLQSDDRMLMQVILVGQPELRDKLKRPNLAQFAQRIAVQYHLSALEREETRHYIAYRLEKAGGKRDIFKPEAVDQIHKVSGGIPRIINLLCDSALVYAFADELPVITLEIVEQVIQDKGGMGFDVSSRTDGLEERSSPSDQTPFVDHRIENLESRLGKLEMQVEWQVNELEQRADGFRDAVIVKLKELLIEERERADRLFSQHTKLREKLEALKREKALEHLQKTVARAKDRQAAAAERTAEDLSQEAGEMDNPKWLNLFSRVK